MRLVSLYSAVVDALVFVPPTLLGVALLIGNKRLAARLLDAEMRYGTARSRQRAKTARRQRQVRVFSVVWCLLFIGLGVGGFVQHL
jgi:hypothetical protein